MTTSIHDYISIKVTYFVTFLYDSKLVDIIFLYIPTDTYFIQIFSSFVAIVVYGELYFLDRQTRSLQPPFTGWHLGSPFKTLNLVHLYNGQNFPFVWDKITSTFSSKIYNPLLMPSNPLFTVPSFWRSPYHHRFVPQRHPDCLGRMYDFYVGCPQLWHWSILPSPLPLSPTWLKTELIGLFVTTVDNSTHTDSMFVESSTFFCFCS